MPRISTKKPKAKVAELPPEAPVETPAVESPERTVAGVKASALAEAERDTSAMAAAETSAELRPPSVPVEPTADTRFEERRGYQRDKIAASLNIAKLQAMSCLLYTSRCV